MFISASISMPTCLFLFILVIHFYECSTCACPSLMGCAAVSAGCDSTDACVCSSVEDTIAGGSLSLLYCRLFGQRNMRLCTYWTACGHHLHLYTLRSPHSRPLHMRRVISMQPRHGRGVSVSVGTCAPTTIEGAWCRDSHENHGMFLVYNYLKCKSIRCN